jgi:multiple sugar transport system permease protein
VTTTPPAKLKQAVGQGAPLAPAVVMLLVFLLGPILWSVYAAFTNTSLSGAGAAASHFVGLANFKKAFAADDFYNSVVLTLVFTLISAIIGQNALGLMLALWMRKSLRSVRALGGAVVIGAWVLPEVVAGYLWYAFLAKDGSLNHVLSGLGLPTQDWLFSLPIVAVSIANIWRGTAFSMLVYSAALSDIPVEIEEAAQVDGASGWRRLVSITLPMIRRSIMTNLMLITLQTLSVFGLIFTMTRGGPGNKSQTLPLYMYEQAFSFGNLGYGTAIAIMLLLVGAVFSLIYLRALDVDTQ